MRESAKISDKAGRVAEIVKAAVDLPAEERRSLVVRECGDDPEVQREVESLLGFLEPASSFIDGNAIELEASAMAAEPDVRAEQRFGDYRLLKRIGAGGMGDVYLAQDTKLRRQVALKFVRAALSSDEMVARFHREEQILASLNHPNIAQLYGGAVSHEMPFFVMEYVEGSRIDQYCERTALPLDGRLQLFRKVCGAVHYAHQHLVVHRDLKPSNILVTTAGEPKLLDFGIAKVLDAAELPTTQTPALTSIMTPDYASPEQVRGGPITTVSDVYSLGVVLYELLTGERPYRTKSRHPDEIARAVTDQEPERPSTAVARAQHRQAASQKRLHGDLDNIVLMAMRKEPARRYLSAAQLSEDIRRHLERRPVIAHRDTLRHRASKFVKRNRLAVVAALLIAVTLLGGIVATLRQKNRAEQRFSEVRQLANEFLFNVDDAIKDLPGATAARALLVQSALEYLDKLQHESRDDPALQREVAAAYLKVGNVQGNPTNANLGDAAGALRSYHKALALAEAASRRSADDPQARRFIGVVLEKIADVEGATGETTKAVETARRSLAIFEEVANATGTDDAKLSLAISRIKVGDVVGNPNMPNIGDRDGAMQSYRASAELLEELRARKPRDTKVRRSIGLIHERMGDVMHASGELDEALAAYRHAFAIRVPLARENPANFEIVRDEAVAHERLARGEAAAGGSGVALEHRRHSLEILARLASADPKNASAQQSLAISYLHLGESLTALPNATEQHIDEAVGNLRRAVDLLSASSSADPTITATKRHLARARAALGRACFAKTAASTLTDSAMAEWLTDACAALRDSLTLWRELEAAQRLEAGDADQIARAASDLRQCETAVSGQS